MGTQRPVHVQRPVQVQTRVQEMLATAAATTMPMQLCRVMPPGCQWLRGRLELTQSKIALFSELTGQRGRAHQVPPSPQEQPHIESRVPHPSLPHPRRLQ